MTSQRISPLTSRKPATGSLLDRARNGRRAAIETRMVTIIQTSSDGKTFVEHHLPAMPRVVDLLARLGAEAQIVSLRTQPRVIFPDAHPDIAAE